MSTVTERTDWTGRELELDTGAVGHGGFCVARHEGRVVFVRHALPDERVRAVVTEDKGGSFCRADAVEVLTAAPGRVEPPCPVAGPGLCGGCDFQHADPALQRRLKADVVTEQLRRIAGLDRAVTVEELPGGPLGWRTRTRVAITADGRPGFRAHRSHTVVAVDGCPITVDGALDPVLAHRWRPGIDIEVTIDDDRRVHLAEVPDGRSTRPVGIAHDAVQRAAGRDWTLDPSGFWQVHPAAADTLAGIVGEWSDAPVGGRAWDLYGGVGLFGAVLAEQVGPRGEVVVVESSRRAVGDGAAALADLRQVRFRAGRVEAVVRRLDGKPDVVVMDPPRAGAGRAVVTEVAARGPGTVVHVGCDPASFARDVSVFGAAGYELVDLRVLDTFPMTHHVECVGLLRPSTG